MQINTKPEFMQVAYAANRKLGLINVTLQVCGTDGQQMVGKNTEHLLDDVSVLPSLQSIQFVGDQIRDVTEWLGFGHFADNIVSRFRMKVVGKVAVILTTRFPAVLSDDMVNRICRFDIIKVIVDGTDPCSDEIVQRIRSLDHPNVHIEWNVARSVDEVRLLRENWIKWQQFGVVQSITIVPSYAARKDHSFWEKMAEQMALMSLDFAKMPQEKRVPYLDGRQEQPLANIANDPEAVKQIEKYPCAVKDVSCFVTPTLDVFPCSFLADGRECWHWNPNLDDPGKHESSFQEQHTEWSPKHSVGYCNSTCRKRCEHRNFQMNMAAAMVENAPLINLE